jgi:hypothetical protein
MGKMKELYMQVYQANDGIPEQMTIGDIIKMKELQIFEWNAYEREQERARLQQCESEDSGENSEISEIEKEYNKHREKVEKRKSKRNKQ